MKSLLIIALLVQLGLSTVVTPPPYQLSAQELIKAYNKVRRNPAGYADLIKAEYLDKGVKGTKGEPTIFSDLEAQLRALKPLPVLVENLAVDLAAWRHAKWMHDKGVFSHKGENGNMYYDRLALVGKFAGRGWSNEIIAAAGGRPTADSFVRMWMLDLGQSWKGHRGNILSLKRPQIGCGFYMGKAVCVSADPLILNDNITDADLAQAGLSRKVNGAGFTGV